LGCQTADANSAGHGGNQQLGWLRQAVPDPDLSPDRLIKHGLTFDPSRPGRPEEQLQRRWRQYQPAERHAARQGLGRTTNIEQIRQIVIDGQGWRAHPVSDVGEVVIGHEIRRGAVTANGQGEVVLGLGFMLMGENSHEVTWAMKDKLKSLEANLPPNVQVKPVYDRTELVDHVIDTVRKNLFEGGLLVIAVLFAFLGNLRAAAIVALAIPLSMLFAFIRDVPLWHCRQSA
jgi:cobalt-zinc-cadmium resistance protein CzcA